MLLFAHTGLTLGITILAVNAIKLFQDNKSHNNNDQVSNHLSQIDQNTWQDKLKSLTSLENQVDMRLLLIGSLLPDIIDKPLGNFVLSGTLNNGRIYSHTLVFLVLLSLLGLFLYRRKQSTGLFILSFGTFIHLILDGIWYNYETLLWPLFGFSFEPAVGENFFASLVHILSTNSLVYVPEIIGLLLIVWFAYQVIRRHQVIAFFQTGRVK
jgi:inner membrane protein